MKRFVLSISALLAASLAAVPVARGQAMCARTAPWNGYTSPVPVFLNENLIDLCDKSRDCNSFQDIHHSVKAALADYWFNGSYANSPQPRKIRRNKAPLRRRGRLRLQHSRVRGTVQQ